MKLNIRRNRQEPAATASAPVIKDANLHQAMNHSSLDKLFCFQRGYPDAIKHIHSNADGNDPASCELTYLERQDVRISRPYQITDTHPSTQYSQTLPASSHKKDLDGNKYLQLIVDDGTC